MKRLFTLKILWISSLWLVISFSSPVFADEEETSGMTMNIPSISKLTIKGSDQIIDLLQDASGEAAYEAGFIKGKNNMPILIVNSNTNWKLSVRVSSGWRRVDKYRKAIADLKLRIKSKTGHQTGFFKFTPLSLTEQEVATYATGVSDDIYYGGYRILLDWERDIPGSYRIIITYTLSTRSP